MTNGRPAHPPSKRLRWLAIAVFIVAGLLMGADFRPKVVVVALLVFGLLLVVRPRRG
jgi:hypothetical protein